MDDRGSLTKVPSLSSRSPEPDGPSEGVDGKGRASVDGASFWKPLRLGGLHPMTPEATVLLAQGIYHLTPRLKGQHVDRH